MTFEAYLADLPLLHSWDNGVTWNTGGFMAWQLEELRRVATQFDRPRIIETGAGNSTLTFLHCQPARLVSIAPDAELQDRIRTYCVDHGLDTAPLEYLVERSEVALPTLAAAGARFEVALIDGGHGWPTVFVDFCYLYNMLRKGGVLLLDDTQLHSVAELSRLLAMQPGFTLLGQHDKLQVWRKETDERFLPKHPLEPYIVEMSRAAAAGQPSAAASGAAVQAVEPSATG